MPHDYYRPHPFHDEKFAMDNLTTRKRVGCLSGSFVVFVLVRFCLQPYQQSVSLLYQLLPPDASEKTP